MCRPGRRYHELPAPAACVGAGATAAAVVFFAAAFLPGAFFAAFPGAAFAATFLVAALFPAGATFFDAAAFAWASFSARSRANRAFVAAMMFRLPAALSLGFGRGVSAGAGGGATSPRILAPLAF